jgi:DNA-directed RNA polymerase subunit beta'
VIAQHLNAAGIVTYSQLAATDPARIRMILDAVGGYGAHDPTTWPDQSQLAAAGEWDQLKEWQDQLDGGRMVGGEAPVVAAPVPVEADDLTRIEGIGAVIASHLINAGITTYSQLAATDPSRIREILDAVGGYGAHDTTTWPDQSQLAATGAWEQLKEWQDQLDGGRPAGNAPSPVDPPAPIQVDDLTKIEGVGPKIAEHLASGGITTFAQLGQASPNELSEFLIAGGFAVRDPSTWPDQARLAAAGEWDKLSEWQDELDGGKIVASDDLTKIEGIGPKAAELLNNAGMASYHQLAATTPEQIKAILEQAGGITATMNPSTWPDQAQLAATGEWDKLKEWQDELDAGV